MSELLVRKKKSNRQYLLNLSASPQWESYRLLLLKGHILVCNNDEMGQEETPVYCSKNFLTYQIA